MENYVIQVKTDKNALLTAIFICFTIKKTMKEEAVTAGSFLECVKLFFGKKNEEKKAYNKISFETDDYFLCPNEAVPAVLEEKIQKDLKSIIINFIKKNKERYIGLIFPYHNLKMEQADKELSLKNIEFENTTSDVAQWYLLALSEITGIHINIFKDLSCEKLLKEYSPSKSITAVIDIVLNSGNCFYIINKNEVHSKFHENFYICSEKEEEKKEEKGEEKNQLALAPKEDYGYMLFFSFLEEKICLLHELTKKLVKIKLPDSVDQEKIEEYQKSQTFFREVDEWKRVYKIGRIKTMENELTDLFYMLPMSEYIKFSHDKNALYVDVIENREIDYVLAYQVVEDNGGDFKRKIEFKKGKMEIDYEMHEIMKTSSNVSNITIKELSKCTAYIIKKIDLDYFNSVVKPVNHYKINTGKFLENAYQKNKSNIKKIAVTSTLAGAVSGATAGAAVGMTGYGVLALGALTGFGFLGLAGFALVGYALKSCSNEKIFENDKNSIDEINQYMNEKDYKRASNLLDEKLFNRKGGYLKIIKNLEDSEANKIEYYLIASYFKGYCHQMEKKFVQAFGCYKNVYEQGMKCKLHKTTDIPFFAGLQILKLMYDKKIDFDFDFYKKIIQEGIGKNKLESFSYLIAKEIWGEIEIIIKNKFHKNFLKEDHLENSIVMQTDVWFLLREHDNMWGDFLELYIFFMQGLIFFQYSFMPFIRNLSDKNYYEILNKSSLKFQTLIELISLFKTKNKNYKCTKDTPEEKIKKSVDIMEEFVLICVFFCNHLKINCFDPKLFQKINSDENKNNILETISFSKKMAEIGEKFMLGVLDEDEKDKENSRQKTLIKIPKFFNAMLFSEHGDENLDVIIKNNSKNFISDSGQTILHEIVQIKIPLLFSYLVPRFRALADMLKKYRHNINKEGETPLFFLLKNEEDTCNFKKILYPEMLQRKNKEERGSFYNEDEKNTVFSDIKTAIENIAKDTSKDSRLFLLEGPPGTGKTFSVKNYIEKKLGHVVEEWVYGDESDKLLGQLEKRIESTFSLAIEKSKKLSAGKFFFIFIDEIDAILSQSEGKPQRGYHDQQKGVSLFQVKIQQLVDEKRKVIVIGATNFIDNLTDAIISRAGGNIFHFYLPNKEKRLDFLKKSLHGYYLENQENALKLLSETTVGYSIRDLCNLLDSIMDSQKGLITEDLIKEKTKVMSLNAEKKFQRKFIFATLHMPNYTNENSFESFINIPEWEAQKQKLQYLNGEKATGLHVLLYGPPGGGKTSAVRDFSSYCKKVLIVLSAAECGSNESNIKKFKEVFEFAKQYHEGCIIFIDEIDRICSSYYMDNKLMAILQTEMDGFHNNYLTVIGATNFLERIGNVLLSRFHLIEFPKLNIHARVCFLRNVFLKGMRIYQIKFYMEDTLSYFLGVHDKQPITETEKTLKYKTECLEIALDGRQDEKSEKQEIKLSARDMNKKIDYWMKELHLFQNKNKYSPSRGVYLRFQEVLWIFMRNRLEALFKKWYGIDEKENYPTNQMYMKAHEDILFPSEQPVNSICLDQVYKLR